MSNLQKRMRIAGFLVSLGLLIEAATLYSLKALSFIAFAGGGALLVAVGIVFFLWSIVSTDGAPPPTSRD